MTILTKPFGDKKGDKLSVPLVGATNFTPTAPSVIYFKILFWKKKIFSYKTDIFFFFLLLIRFLNFYVLKSFVIINFFLCLLIYYNKCF